MRGGAAVLVEQESRVRVTNMRNKLIGDVQDMITGFLKNNRMEPSTDRRDNVGGVSVGRSWIPLKNRETVFVLHEIAVNCINVNRARQDNTIGNKGSRFGKRTSSCCGFPVAGERTRCVPTWVVLTCGCGGVTEMDVHRRRSHRAALTSPPCEAQQRQDVKKGQVRNTCGREHRKTDKSKD